MKTTIQLTLIAIAILISSCNKCKNVLPTPQYFELTFVDDNNNNLLGTTYNQTSFKLYTDNSTIWLSYEPTSQGEILRVSYAEINADINYYLDLSSTDTDTLKIKFTKIEEKCYDDYNVNTFTYNGQNLTFDKGVQFKIVK